MTRFLTWWSRSDTLEQWIILSDGATCICYWWNNFKTSNHQHSSEIQDILAHLKTKFSSTNGIFWGTRKMWEYKTPCWPGFPIFVFDFNHCNLCRGLLCWVIILWPRFSSHFCPVTSLPTKLCHTSSRQHSKLNSTHEFLIMPMPMIQTRVFHRVDHFVSINQPFLVNI